MSKSEDILNDPSFRNICFIGGGNLSKGSKNKKAATLERFSKAWDKEQKDKIKILVLDMAKGIKPCENKLRSLVNNLNLIKDGVDPLHYQSTGFFDRDLRVLRTFVQKYLSMKYLKVFAKYDYDICQMGSERKTVFVLLGEQLNCEDGIREYTADISDENVLSDGSINLSQLKNCFDVKFQIFKNSVHLSGYVDPQGGHVGHSTASENRAFISKELANKYLESLI